MKKGYIVLGLVGAVLIFGSMQVVSHFSMKRAFALQEVSFQHINNVQDIMEFAKLIEDYQAYDLNDQYVLIQITKIASPLYEQEETRDIAFSMEKVSGMLQDGKIEDLNVFMESEFQKQMEVYSEKAQSQIDELM